MLDSPRIEHSISPKGLLTQGAASIVVGLCEYVRRVMKECVGLMPDCNHVHHSTVKTITRDVSSQSIHYSWPYIKQFLADKRQYLDIYVKFLRGLETGKPVQCSSSFACLGRRQRLADNSTWRISSTQVVTPLEEEILARLEQRYEFVHLLTYEPTATESGTMSLEVLRASLMIGFGVWPTRFLRLKRRSKSRCRRPRSKRQLKMSARSSLECGRR